MSFDVSRLVADEASRGSFWGWDGIWSTLVTADETSGAYSVMEQSIPQNGGPPPHVHERSDEVFYILDGEIRLQIGDQLLEGHAGQLVRIPRGTAHGFAIKSASARFLNLYVPAMLDTMIEMLSTPATEKRLPRAEEQAVPTTAQIKAFHERLEALATQTWSDQKDLLAAFRPKEDDTGAKPGSATH